MGHDPSPIIEKNYFLYVNANFAPNEYAVGKTGL